MNSELNIFLLVLLGILLPPLGLLCIVSWYKDQLKKNREETNKRIDEKHRVDNILYTIQDRSIEISTYEFFELKKTKLVDVKKVKGVYILHNYQNGKYYVGQSKSVFDRVNNHFTGKGNGDIYVDYKKGDRFTIKMIPLSGSGFYDLDSLERHFIEYYHAYDRGYNKTRGNR